MVPTLWRYTSNALPRELARLVGTSERKLRQRVRVSYVKVAEYQRRGALHFHVLVRLDRATARRGRKDRAALAGVLARIARTGRPGGGRAQGGALPRARSGRR
jgi:hypothetical protein